MKNVYVFLSATVLAAACDPIFAQTPPAGGIVYQQAGVFSTGTANAFFNLSVPALGSEFFAPDEVTGSPLSATHQTHSLQVLGDGTRIERTESHQIYRDSQGRTRVESGPANARTVMIQDPVASTTIILNGETRAAQQMPAPHIGKAVAFYVNAPHGDLAQTQLVPPPGVSTAGPGMPAAGITAGVAGAMTKGIFIARTGGPGEKDSVASKELIDELPAQNINGVLATGHRTTMTIDAGKIGNDRPIQVVAETWYSGDLQMMVKSSNSDPRFGDTSFELTNIVRSEPDPALFQVPSDYTVSNPKTEFKVLQPKK